MKLREEGPDSSLFKAEVELGLGRVDDAMDSLEAAAEVFGTHLWALGFYAPSPSSPSTNPFDPLKGKPRFQKIVERIGLTVSD